MSELSGRVTIVTAAASGIGRATALLFAERGAEVVLVDIDEAGLKAVADDCRTLGAEVLDLTVDQRESGQVNAAVDTIVDRFGRVDVIANIVGIYPFAFIENITDEQWENVIRTNLTGIFYWCRKVLPVMKAQRSGSIVNVTSTGTAGLGAYGASKGGLTYFTQHALAAEAGPHGIRVNLVSPGATDVGGTPPAGADAETILTGIRVASGGPKRHLARPREIAEVIAFLASDRASSVHGANYGVNVGGPLGPPMDPNDAAPDGLALS